MSGIGRPHGLSMSDFFSRYGTEDQCREALFAKRWPNGFVCLKMCRQHLLPQTTQATHVRVMQAHHVAHSRHGDAPHAAEPLAVVHGYVLRR
ncbi:transposase [Ferrimicrobium acidiphilum]|uniref:Transposase n=1 Tax=Ferrimicrobium acidiphilum TaxID=121039 RepID=A0ABV3Y444_9ACTN